jgi:hypothetical protein
MFTDTLRRWYLPTAFPHRGQRTCVNPETVAHIGASDPEDHVFSDVGGMIGHAFQIAGDDDGI